MVWNLDLFHTTLLIHSKILSHYQSWIVGQRITAKKTKSDYCIRIDDNRVAYDNLGDIAELENSKED